MSKLRESGHYVIHVLLIVVIVWLLSSTKDNKSGRYEVCPGEGTSIYILDTKTGELWHRKGQMLWDFGTLQESIWDFRDVQIKRTIENNQRYKEAG